MSIVGTRPPLISETNLYELHHRARLAIKPGITGMWQVSGRSDITDFEEVVRLDNEYYFGTDCWYLWYYTSVFIYIECSRFHWRINCSCSSSLVYRS